VEAEIDGVGGVDGLAGSAGVTVSGDGAHVYVSSAFENAVAIFSRDAITGGLTYLGQVEDGVGGVDGLDRAVGLVISADGRLLFVCGVDDDAVAVFRRDPASGALTFLEVFRDGYLGADGLAGAFIPALDPDGEFLYVTGRNDHGLAVFEVFPEGLIFRDDFESGDTTAWSSAVGDEPL